MTERSILEHPLARIGVDVPRAGCFVESLEPEEVTAETIQWMIWRLRDIVAILSLRGFMYQQDEHLMDLAEMLCHGPGTTPRQRAKAEMLLDAIHRAQLGKEEDCPRGIHQFTPEFGRLRCLYCGETEEAPKR